MLRGFSLLELVLILALAGILLGLAVPPLSRAIDRIEVQAAANHIAAAHSRARLLAITQSQVVILSVDPIALTIRRRGGLTPLWAEAGPGAAGVSLSGASHNFTFSPEGFSIGLSNATLRLSRGAASRAVIVSRLGRVRVVR